MDQRTRKLITMHKALHPRDDVDKLWALRKEGGKGLASIKDSIDASIRRLEDYIVKTQRRTDYSHQNDTEDTMDNRMTITRKQEWGGKQLYRRFKRINNISPEKTWTWLRKENFMGETKSLLIAAQDNAVRTIHIKEGIDKTQQNSKCRLCGERWNHQSHNKWMQQISTKRV